MTGFRIKAPRALCAKNIPDYFKQIFFLPLVPPHIVAAIPPPPPQAHIELPLACGVTIGTPLRIRGVQVRGWVGGQAGARWPVARALVCGHPASLACLLSLLGDCRVTAISFSPSLAPEQLPRHGDLFPSLYHRSFDSGA